MAVPLVASGIVAVLHVRGLATTLVSRRRSSPKTSTPRSPTRCLGFFQSWAPLGVEHHRHLRHRRNRPRVLARHQSAHEEGRVRSSSARVKQLISRARRRYGGYIVHIGIVLMYIGFTGAAYDIEEEAALRPGQVMEIEYGC